MRQPQVLIIHDLDEETYKRVLVQDFKDGFRPGLNDCEVSACKSALQFLDTIKMGKTVVELEW